MKSSRLLITIVALAAALGLGAVLMRSRDPAPDGYTLKKSGAGSAIPDDSLRNGAPTVDRKGRSSGPKPDPANGTLALLGRVQSEAQATLTVRAPARILRVSVQEGDFVRPGQLLVQLDDRDLRVQEHTAQAAVAAADAQWSRAQVARNAQKIKADVDLASARSGLQQAQTKYQQALLARDAARSSERLELITAQEGVRKAAAALARAQENLRGLEELARVGGVARNDLEGARTQVTLTQSDLDTARAQVQRLKAGPAEGSGISYQVALAQKDVDAAQAGLAPALEGVHTALEARTQTLALADEDIRAARAALDQAKDGVATAQTALKETRLFSPIAGTVTGVGAHAGETAQPGVPLLTVVSLAGLRVEALAPATLLPLLHPGQSARIAVDSMPGRAFPATLGEIARIAEADGRTFRVRFRFPQAVPFHPGQTARVTVLR